MKEFNVNFVNIFGGLNPERVIKKNSPKLLSCHNIEPLAEDYTLHEVIIDMNATGQNWNNVQDIPDYWQDHEDDNWTDDSDDEFIDI